MLMSHRRSRRTHLSNSRNGSPSPTHQRLTSPPPHSTDHPAHLPAPPPHRQCCFASSDAPTDAQLDRIIDRTRKEGEEIGEGFGGKQHTAADFDATAPMLNMRELQGATYGGEKEQPTLGGGLGGLRDLEGLLGAGGGGSGPSTLADIDEQWRALQQGKRQGKARFSTVKVAGVVSL